MFSILRNQSEDMSNQSKLESAYEEFTVKLRKKLQSEINPTDLYYDLGLIRLELVEIRDSLSDEKKKKCFECYC